MSETGHKWSGWPGAICLKCGTEDYLEIAVADNWYDPFTKEWDTPEHEAEFKRSLVCPADAVKEKP